MKESALQWLAGRAAPAGMLACGLRRTDGTLVCRSGAEGCPAGSMEKILDTFAHLRATLFSETFSPRWTTWKFERGQIRLAERADGWLLGLVVRADLRAAPDLDPLCEEFLALELGDEA